MVLRAAETEAVGLLGDEGLLLDERELALQVGDALRHLRVRDTGPIRLGRLGGGVGHLPGEHEEDPGAQDGHRRARPTRRRVMPAIENPSSDGRWRGSYVEPSLVERLEVVVEVVVEVGRRGPSADVHPADGSCWAATVSNRTRLRAKVAGTRRADAGYTVANRTGVLYRSGRGNRCAPTPRGTRRPSSSGCSTSRRWPAASSTTPAARATGRRTSPFRTGSTRGSATGLAARGIERLYIHQAAALEAVRAGEDVVVVTPTASGKTLCYTIPTLQAIADDPAARALYLFPTKALGQDQVAEFTELSRAAGLAVSAATYDGDTPAPIRSAIRTAGQVVVTNPDMLHSAILPHHTKWFQLFEQLRIIVIDELHSYRGVFGSHVANVLRRLLRLCAHYGSHPIIVCCSATIGNPAELATALTGRPTALVDRNGAPAGERHVLLVDPPLLDRADRRPRLGAHPRPALGPAVPAGRSPDGRVRPVADLGRAPPHRPARVAPRELGPRSRLRGYRGGYLPTERRAIERGLRDGEVLGVVSTNALELGVDIGRLDAAILAGYPGSIAATWQQMGRAGRRGAPSVAVLVASASPVDQYVIHHPEYLLAHTPEEARVDPDNLHILLAHLRAATFELPFEPGEVFGPAPADDLLAFLAEEGHVRQAGDGRWYWSSENFPASEISLRTAAPENVVIIDTTPDRPRVLGEVDLFSAQVLVHERAIYIHESSQYYVDRLDWGEKKAYVHRVDVDHYTYANRAVTLKPLEVFAEAPAPGGRRVHGEVMVASLVTLFKKLKFVTDENVGLGTDRPAGARAPDDRLLADGRRRGAGVAAQRARHRPHGRRAGDPDRRQRPAHGRPARPRARLPGPLAAPRGADDLPVRGGARRDRPVRAAVRAPRRAHRRGHGPHRRVRLRRRLPGLHRPAPRAGRRRQGARPPTARPARRRTGHTDRRPSRAAVLEDVAR